MSELHSIYREKLFVEDRTRLNVTPKLTCNCDDVYQSFFFCCVQFLQRPLTISFLLNSGQEGGTEWTVICGEL